MIDGDTRERMQKAKENLCSIKTDTNHIRKLLGMRSIAVSRTANLHEILSSCAEYDISKVIPLYPEVLGWMDSCKDIQDRVKVR